MPADGEQEYQGEGGARDGGEPGTQAEEGPDADGDLAYCDQDSDDVRIRLDQAEKCSDRTGMDEGPDLSMDRHRRCRVEVGGVGELLQPCEGERDAEKHPQRQQQPARLGEPGPPVAARVRGVVHALHGRCRLPVVPTRRAEG